MKNINQQAVVNLVICGSDSYIGKHFIDADRKRLEAVCIQIPTDHTTRPLHGLTPAEFDKAAIEEYWHFPTAENIDKYQPEKELCDLKESLALARDLGVKRFYFLSSIFSCGNQTGVIKENLHGEACDFDFSQEKCVREAEDLVVKQCAIDSIDFVIFRTGIVIGPRGSKSSESPKSGLYTYIQNIDYYNDILRLTDFGIGICIDQDVDLHLVPVDDLVSNINTLLDNSRGYMHSTNAIHQITTPCKVRPAEFLELLSHRLDIPVLNAVASGGERSPIELAIDFDLAIFGRHWNFHRTFDCSAPTAHSLSKNDLKEYIAQLTIQCRTDCPQHIVIGESPDSEVKKITSIFERSLFTNRDGTGIHMYNGHNRNKPAVVFLNALGMPIEFFLPLAEVLKDDFHLLSMDSRGCPNLEPAFDIEKISLEDQISDLEQILEQEKIANVHLIGWCTGVQLALSFAAANPEKVSSLTLINGNYSLADTPKTQYEKTMSDLVGYIEKDRRYATIYQAVAFGINGADDSVEAHKKREEELINIMIALPPELLHLASLPYKSEESFYRYAKLHGPFYRSDMLATCKRVSAPTLIVTSDADLLVSPDGSKKVAAEIENSTLFNGNTGSHFMLYGDKKVSGLIHSHLLKFSKGTLPAREELSLDDIELETESPIPLYSAG